MSDPARVETPLHYARARQGGPLEPGVLIREAPLMGHLNLRGNPGDPAFVAGVEAVLGVPLPTSACTCARDADTRIYWLGPEEWLVIIAAGCETELENRLRGTLQGHFSVVDISGGQTLLNLSGGEVATLLQKASHYDFHPANFGPGRCAQTTFAKATALVAGCEDGSFELVIRRSFADYLARWLLDAAAEWGGRLQ